MGIASVFRSKRDGRIRAAGNDTDMELYKFFKVVKVIGKGSYSTVYEVQRLSDGRHYALKQTPVQSLNARERKDMVNEIRLLASLEHPNLMQYYEAFVDHHQLCIVADLATGDLAKLIDKLAESGDWLPERQVWSYFIQLALALQYLHHHHVLHRDLKPQNILISPCGLLKLGDLGIAQVLDHVFTRALIGTVYYMSPEMWRKDPYSYSADIWALGCVLYELCALKPLFMAKSHTEIKAKVLSGLVDPLPSRYSLELWEVMTGCLMEDPAHRPTVDELLAMPAVQAHLPLAPQEGHPLLHQAAGHSHAQLLQPIEVPRVSADWEHINAFMPPAKYSVGPSVADSLRMKASRSCPELRAGAQGSGAEGSSAEQGGAEQGGAGKDSAGSCASGRAALCGPSASDAALSFGSGRQELGSGGQGAAAAAPASSGVSFSRRVTEPAEAPAAAAVRKVPSAGTMRELLRSHTVAVGEVVFNTQKGCTGRSSQGSVEGGGSSGGAAAEQQGRGGAGGRLSPLEARAIATAVAEAWERKASVAGRHSVTVAQVLQNHTATASTAQQHRRHQDRQLLLGSAERFSPAPVEFCPPPRPKAAAPAGPAAAASVKMSNTAGSAAAAPAGASATASSGAVGGSAAGGMAMAPAGAVAAGSKAAAAASKQEVTMGEKGPKLLRFLKKKLGKQ